jgi:3-isopropylmalate/(R)-2-methylmalate dehydratase large subunit
VPKTAKFNITGKLQKGVTARDVFEYVLREIGPAGVTGQVMEWTGPVIDAMSMDSRFTLTSQALFTGALTGIINPDKTTLDWVRPRAVMPFDPVVSDPDAEYSRVYNFDVSKLVPQVATPPKRHMVKDVTEVVGKKVQKGFIGSCANGRIEDMRMIAGMLKGRKIHPEVMLNITPATTEVLLQCVKEGLMETFINAEAALPSPACGQCYGANTPLAGAEVCMATSTCNYPGRMGSTEAEIYLASPATVAASCIEGKIADPRKYL